MKTNRIETFILSLLALLIIFSNSAVSATATHTTDVVEKNVNSFYKAGSMIDLNKILNLSSFPDKQILSISLEYHMVFSSLNAHWYLNNNLLNEMSLKKGLKQTAVFEYNKDSSGKFYIKLIGDKGQIQLKSVKAILADKAIVETTSQSVTSTTVVKKSSKLSGQDKREPIKFVGKINKSVSGKTFSNNQRPDDPSASKQADKSKKLESQADFNKKVKIEPITLKIITPKYQNKWEIFKEYPIQWESTGLSKGDKIGIAIRQKSNNLSKIIAITQNSGEFKYKVPYPIILTGYDIQVILTPLKDRSVESYSDLFAIMKPEVDLISNTPQVTFEVKKRKRKWWEKIGDVFTMGVTWYANEMVELSVLKSKGATLKISLGVIQKGSKSLKNVEVDCTITSLNGMVIHHFTKQNLSELMPDQIEKLVFSDRTKEMGLSKGSFNILVNIDPFNRHSEIQRLRENNQIKVQFEVKN